ncbi:uncharacterized protein LOC135474961 [Liolophura sinensis]|uniref:uncharacterized protein LOC135474961 n=1 Tax=Liolophura sinensis TaxID=3198878 RepID=UPI0031597679
MVNLCPAPPSTDRGKQTAQLENQIQPTTKVQQPYAKYTRASPPTPVRAPKGLNFVPTTKTIPKDDFIVDIEEGLQQLAPGGHIDYLRHQIASLLDKAQPQRTNLTKEESRALAELKKDKSITIAPADKGKAAAILDKTDFNKLVDNLLTDQSTYRTLKTDPTNKFDRQHRSLLNQLKTSGEITPEIQRKLTVQHPRAPYARATIKIHKDPVKARLLICSRGTVFYNTAQYLTRLLSLWSKAADSFIKDSADFCNKIRQINEPCKLVSYDVIDLFTNVPTSQALDVIRDKITTTPPTTSLSPDNIIRLLDCCLSSTYFTWGDTIYEQIHGLPMGSPLSPIVSEIYLTELENKALATSPIQPIYVHVKRTADALQTTVYRKPTHSDQYIHYKSNHPPKTKTGIISTLTKRAKLICNSNLDEEIQHLRTVSAHLNGYPADQVNKTIQKSSQPEHNQQSRVHVEGPGIRINLPYIGPTSHKIARLIKQTTGIETVFRSLTTLKTHLHATGKKTPTKPQPPKGVVYQLKCSCNNSYIGETGRPLQTRIKEHQSSVQKLDSKSAISDHIHENPSHNINWNTVRTLNMNQPHWKKRKLQEAIQIKRLKPSLNRDHGIYLPSAYDLLILQTAQEPHRA